MLCLSINGSSEACFGPTKLVSDPRFDWIITLFQYEVIKWFSKQKIKLLIIIYYKTDTVPAA
jgi:hypothetical protein